MSDQELKKLISELNALPRLSKEEMHKHRWSNRTKRLKRLIELDAPECIIENECISILEVNGLYKNVWRHLRAAVRLELWYYVKFRFWWTFVLGKSEDEIDDLIR
jgi:hypothetical protein